MEQESSDTITDISNNQSNCDNIINDPLYKEIKLNKKLTEELKFSETLCNQFKNSLGKCYQDLQCNFNNINNILREKRELKKNIGDSNDHNSKLVKLLVENVEKKNNVIQRKDIEIQEKNKEIQEKIQEKDTVIQKKDNLIQQKDNLIKAKDKLIQGQKKEIKNIQKKYNEIKKDVKKPKQDEVDKMTREKDNKIQELVRKVQEKNNEIQNLARKIQDLEQNNYKLKDEVCEYLYALEAATNFRLSDNNKCNSVKDDIITLQHSVENCLTKCKDEKMALQEIKILVAIDFGTNYSSFAFVHKENPKNIETNHSWPGREGVLKTPTVLRYNETYTQVISWGHLALDEDDSEERSHLIELFKLHLSDLKDNRKHWLPPQLDYKKVIVDYLTQMRILIESTLDRRWPTIRFPQQVEFILTISDEWQHHNTRVLRECAFRAGLLTTLNSANLEFIIEQDAVALYCLSVVKDHNFHSGVADCGDSTVDIISRKFLQNKLSEITKRVGDLYGSTLVDKEFLLWLGRKVGSQALEKLKRRNYEQMQHLIQRFFCYRIKFKFDGDPESFKSLKLNLKMYCSDLQQYVAGEYKQQMEEAGWVIKLDFESVKEMFDPVISRIIKLVDNQLNDARERCCAIFLVGEFSQSPYLLSRVREAFINQVPIITVPASSSAAAVKGAIIYELNVEIE
ncbi:hypothetical protein GLOIN_2v1646242 [Rhizophagus clarus]|uniref:Hsp70 family protein n=1 Tax=Rhizophagus clarus TaxID=94130 RepID=A0A8H3M622_9GLOM|nr:hypothetical protein GLOIN_2v1646242 [Rhizophagus clarus]